MKRKYHWVIALPPDDFINMLIESRSSGFTIKQKENKIVIQRPRYIFGRTIPVNYQVSFFAKVHPSESITTLDGKFDAPRLFYFIVWFFSLSIVSMLFSSSYYQANLLDYLLNCIILVIFTHFIIRFYIFVSTKIFNKENKDVINLLDSFQTKYGQKFMGPNTGDGLRENK